MTRTSELKSKKELLEFYDSINGTVIINGSRLQLVVGFQADDEGFESILVYDDQYKSVVGLDLYDCNIIEFKSKLLIEDYNEIFSFLKTNYLSLLSSRLMTKNRTYR